MTYRRAMSQSSKGVWQNQRDNRDSIYTESKSKQDMTVWIQIGIVLLSTMIHLEEK